MKDKPKYLWTPLQGFVFFILIISGIFIVVLMNEPDILNNVFYGFDGRINHTKLPVSEMVSVFNSIFSGIIFIFCTSLACLFYSYKN